MYSKVWGLNGLKSDPLEVGKLASPSPSLTASSTSVASRTSQWPVLKDTFWLEQFSASTLSRLPISSTPTCTPKCISTSTQKPKQRLNEHHVPCMRIQKYGSSSSAGSNICFSILTIVDNLFCTANSELEFLKREWAALEPWLEQRVQVLLKEEEKTAQMEAWVKLVDPTSCKHPYTHSRSPFATARSHQAGRTPPTSARVGWRGTWRSCA
ncbi:hypothetical protein GALMADRAFT_142602 [Galerina marginata CBS 339.88]|uniref:Uncharacterized protein n=1 Tax=Galerina marginata (strain CBS 339.88) TaxID=685588 RepID=A0A067T1J5_GALM3|nr:hypothetical protein GALMADRAFT_142602 [Galerina marginata CBS 339.88]